MSVAPESAHLTPGPHETRQGVVSVILVNYKGADDTIACLKYLTAIDWPHDRLELIVVENDSQDGSTEQIAAAVPSARVIPSGANLGFAGGCNFGVDQATGEYVAFLNNDARPDRNWVRAAVAALESDAQIGAIACKVLDWDGTFIDYVDGSLSWFGMGYKREAEDVDKGLYEEPKGVLFGTGAAMFMRADVFRTVGGFDERFFMFYEDVDLGWRLNLLGYKVRYIPQSVAYHRHHVTMNKFGNFRESYLLERNALLSMFKNYDDHSLAQTLPAAVSLAVRRGTARAKLDTSVLPDDASFEASKMGLTGIYGVDYLVEQLPSLVETRQRLQAARTVSDRDLFPLFRQALEPAYPVESYVQAHDLLVKHWGIDTLFAQATNVLVVTGDPISSKLAGPAIRAWEIASALAHHHHVRLVSTRAVSDVPDAPFDVVYSNGIDLMTQTDWADVIVFQGWLLEQAFWLKDSSKIVVADIYDPMHFEQLEQAKDRGPYRRAEQIRVTTDVLNNQLARADYFICASQKQRDLWVGELAAMGRINPLTVGNQQTLDSLIGIVPFGLENEDPVQTKHGLRGAVPGIGMDDKVIVWGGGVYNWFDPLTLVKAIAKLSRTHPDVRLYFMGLRHPNVGVPPMRIAAETQKLSEELGLTDRFVFFNSDWVPYAERQNVLMDADVGVSTHFEHVETEFSFRTRILDYLWTDLPIVATTGDSFGNILDQENIGRGVPPQDVDALAGALEEMLYDDEAAAQVRASILQFRNNFRWSKVLQPLVDFVDNPHRARDLVLSTGSAEDNGLIARANPPAKPTITGDIKLVTEYLKAGGPKEVIRRAQGRVRRQLGLQR